MSNTTDNILSFPNRKQTVAEDKLQSIESIEGLQQFISELLNENMRLMQQCDLQGQQIDELNRQLSEYAERVWLLTE